MSGKSGSVVSTLVHKSYTHEQEEETREAFESERQARTRPVMLVVIQKNGDEDLLSYSLFRRASKREGGRRWKLIFDDCNVIVTGRNLGEKLRDLLRLQRLSVLREGNLVEDELTAEDKAFIESIKVDEKE